MFLYCILKHGRYTHNYNFQIFVGVTIVGGVNLLKLEIQQEAIMLLSMREMVVWLGVGPFEAFLHSVGLLFFVLLLTLRVEQVLMGTWHIVFIPLYTALALDAYYNAIQYTRIINFVVREKQNIFFSIFHFVMLLIRITLLVYAEIETANVLDGSSEEEYLILPYLLIFCFLVFRLVPVTRSVKSEQE